MTKVMVFGSFDTLHPGHLNFFRQAKKYGELTVVIARDKTIEKVKGRLPKYNQKERLNALKKIPSISKRLIGNEYPYKIIEEENPEIICLGYDQKAFVEGLTKKFPDIKIIRLKPYKPEKYKSSKLKKQNSHKKSNHKSINPFIPS